MTAPAPDLGCCTATGWLEQTCRGTADLLDDGGAGDDATHFLGALGVCADGCQSGKSQGAEYCFVHERPLFHGWMLKF